MIEIPFPVVLASQSPQRRRLLKNIIGNFDVEDPSVDETVPTSFTVIEAVTELARRKASVVAKKHPNALIIAADTIVECLGEVMGKPEDGDDAVRMLLKLSRNPHSVITGVCTITPEDEERSFVSHAQIQMRQFSRQEAETYVREEPTALERSGAYALREFDPNVESIEGSREAVQGLPIHRLEEVLKTMYQRA
ncbi:MAG: Maf family protein [Candidatus Brocadiia bacterium]